MNEPTLSKARRYARRVYNEIRRDRTDRRSRVHPSFAAQDALLAANEKFDLGMFGTEGWAVDLTHGVTYLNAGDVYALTLIVRTGPYGVRFHVGCLCDEPRNT